VYSCNGAAVETTVCDGRILMLNREIPGEEEILAGAAKAAHELVSRSQSA
jgi:5-methylthioadenosine/S-adenosylhomocysteine deaminase